MTGSVAISNLHHSLWSGVHSYQPTALREKFTCVISKSNTDPKPNNTTKQSTIDHFQNVFIEKYAYSWTIDKNIKIKIYI